MWKNSQREEEEGPTWSEGEKILVKMRRKVGETEG